MNDKPRYIHKDILMQVVGDHPHAGDKGYPVGENPNTITEVMGMYEIEFVNGMCEHGTRGCFAKKQNLRMLKRPARAAHNIFEEFPEYSMQPKDVWDSLYHQYRLKKRVAKIIKEREANELHKRIEEIVYGQKPENVQSDGERRLSEGDRHSIRPTPRKTGQDQPQPDRKQTQRKRGSDSF